MNDTTPFVVCPEHHWYIKRNRVTADRICHDCKDVSSRLEVALEKFSDEMEDYYFANVQTSEEFAAKMKLRNMLEKILQNSSHGRDGWPKSVVVITGSSVTGLASKNSDVDICVAIPDALAHFNSEIVAARTCVKIMEYRLADDEEFYNLVVKEKSGKPKLQFVDASIPVLKFTVLIDGFTIECDLSTACNREGFISSFHNSFLLRHYVKFDRRVAPLCFFIKKWAKNLEIYNPVEGRLNSYCLTLLVLHYLQCGLDPPLLPNFIQIYPSFFASTEQEFPQVVDFDASLPWPVDDEPYNSLSMGQLFYGFISYYNEFDFKAMSIDMKNACINRKRVSNDRCRVLDIIDPIDRHNPGRTLRREGLEYIQGILGSVREVFRNAALNDDDVRDSLPPFNALLGENQAFC
ncbi:unnamed protein product, partial [Mesorhabditis belari]|uniref:Polymerase nucleotidyl transferase domain-containing protein n=1 Tax=Mesorhabditis belari TaxID=2138241 RepID=A0AAF3FF13_9BILA